MQSMKNDYLHLWLVLAVALGAMALLSVTEGVDAGPVKLKSSGLVQALTSRPDADISAQLTGTLTAAETAALDSVAPPSPAPVDTAEQTILFIGDSMLEGLYPRLAAYCEASGHTLYAVIWYSSTSRIWGEAELLTRYIQQLQPSFVFICLGSNELFVRDIRDKNTAAVRALLGELGETPYLWIGPPNWRKDTGINALLAAETAPGTFFLSDGMTFERSKDGAHPTRTSAAEWMDSVVRWMPLHASHPIRLDAPVKPTARAKRVFTHQPGEKP